MALAGCGEDDFENDPRPPTPVQLSGVITDEKVTVSPADVGAGPVVITLSNQTKQSHTVTLEGGSVREQTAAINPLDTATIQRTLEPGQYTVAAGSEAAVEREIAPATLEIGPERESGSDDLLLP
jgi:hypothetical protein